MSWRGDSDIYTLLNVYTLLDCNVLTTTATQSALRVGTTSEVYEIESRVCAKIGALLTQITKPIPVCLSYSDKEYPLKIEYLEMRRKIKRITLYSVHEKLRDDAQLPSRIQDQQ